MPRQELFAILVLVVAVILCAMVAGELRSRRLARREGLRRESAAQDWPRRVGGKQGL